MGCDGGGEAEDDGRGGLGSHWWWAGGSAAQLAWGISSYLRGYAGDSRLMPVKAFSVASLFVSSAASASIAPSLRFLDVGKSKLLERQQHSVRVEDLMEVGANIRTGLGVPPRAQVNKKTDDL